MTTDMAKYLEEVFKSWPTNGSLNPKKDAKAVVKQVTGGKKK